MESAASALRMPVGRVSPPRRPSKFWRSTVAEGSRCFVAGRYKAPSRVRSVLYKPRRARAGCRGATSTMAMAHRF